MKNTHLGLVAAACLLCLGSCTKQAPSSVTETAPPVLHAYDVPAGMQNEMSMVLNNLLWRGENQPKAGNVAVAPNGQVLVSAPAEFHPGVGELLQRMKDQKAAPTPTLILDVWLLAGSPAKDKTAPDALGNDLATVVDGIQAAQGPMALQLLEHDRVQGMSGSQVDANGVEVELRSRSTLQGDGVLADLRLRRTKNGGRMEVRTALPLDKIVVLGQLGDAGDEKQPGAKSGTAFYVVRAQKAD